MKVKTSMGIGTKISIQLMALLAVVLVGMLAYIIVTTVKTSTEAEYMNIAALSDKNALLAQGILEQSLDKAVALADILKGYEGIEPKTRRETINNVMKSMVQADGSILGMWTCWEPNALDGMDASYAGTGQSDGAGRFIPYWVWVDGSVETMPLVDYDKPGLGDYYLLARNSGETSILEPYEYEINGKKVLLTSMAVPIKEGNGKVVGVAGVDITLEA